jgi:putative sigma-54 modulation protein
VRPHDRESTVVRSFRFLTEEGVALNIKITGRSEAVTAGMKRRAAEKVGKVMKFYDRITWMDVILDVDKQRHRVEVSAGLSRGTTVVGKAESDDMYSAIDQSIDKIARQLRKHKEKLKDHRS